jgi:hypothetical protein
MTDGGSSTVPVYFSGGIPQACTTLSLDTTGSAAKWTNSINISIADNDKKNTSTSIPVDGSDNVTLKLPETIKATLEGNASTATTAEEAKKLSVDNTGSNSKPVYFSGGIPTECGDRLAVNITGSAEAIGNFINDPESNIIQI